MKNLLSEHPALVMALVFFIGWTVHWIVGLLFFRARFFEQDATITRLSRDVDDARFQLTRTQTDLRSKTDLLDAVQKSKSALEQKAHGLAGELLSAQGVAAELAARAETHAAAAATAQNRLQSELAALSTQPQLPPVIPGDPILVASLDTLRDKATHLQNRLDETLADIAEATARTVVLERSLAVEKSVRETLARAVQARDESLQEMREELEELETRLAASEEDRTAAVAQQEARQTEETSLRQEIDRERRARTSLDMVLKERETQLAEAERKAQEFQEAFNEAVEENKRVSDEARKAKATHALAETALKGIDQELKGLKARHAKLETEAADLRKTTTAINSTAQAATKAQETELATLRIQLDTARAAADASTAALANLEDQLATRTRDFRKLQDQNEALAEELQSLTKANESLTEQLQRTTTSTPSESSDGEQNSDVTAILTDLDTVTRERNELAAELAALKTATPGNRKPARPGSSPSGTGDSESD